MTDKHLDFCPSCDEPLYLCDGVYKLTQTCSVCEGARCTECGDWEDDRGECPACGITEVCLSCVYEFYGLCPECGELLEASDKTPALTEHLHILRAIVHGHGIKTIREENKTKERGKREYGGYGYCAHQAEASVNGST